MSHIAFLPLCSVFAAEHYTTFFQLHHEFLFEIWGDGQAYPCLLKEVLFIFVLLSKDLVQICYVSSRKKLKCFV